MFCGPRFNCPGIQHGLLFFDKVWKTFDPISIQISCNIIDLASNVCSTIVYNNESEHPVEARYTFPLNNVAVYSFEAEIDDRKIIAQCRPRDEAKTTYDEAVSTGHMAFMARQDEHCEDIFEMTLGAIPSHAKVTIKLKFVGLVEAENVISNGKTQSLVKFILPTVLNPRYQPREQKSKDEFEKLAALTTKPYSMQFEAEIKMPIPVIDVHSTLDTFNTEWASSDNTIAKVKMTSEFKSDHDLQMTICLDGALDTFAVCESGDKQASSLLTMDCFMTQWMPDFSRFQNKQDLRTELYFVIDRSGSMSGDRIQKAAQSLLLFLKSIPVGCRFQIIGFGNTFATLFPEPVEYNDANVERAMQYQRDLVANMGGTEVLPALREAFRSPLTGVGWYKQIIFLTDGDVRNADEVIGLVRSNVNQARVFAIGIGTGASTFLVEGVARAGRGLSTFVRDNNELRGATMKILNAALQPRASNVTIKWDVTAQSSTDGNQSPVEIIGIPQQIPPIFSGCFTSVYGLFKPVENATLTGQITLECDLMGEKQSLRIDVAEVMKKRTISPSNTTDLPLHRLAGKCQLIELGDKHKALTMRTDDEQKDETALADMRTQIERLSCAINIVSPFTALIGVDPVKNEPLPKPAPPPQPMPLAYGRPMCGAAPRASGLIRMKAACTPAMCDAPSGRGRFRGATLFGGTPCPPPPIATPGGGMATMAVAQDAPMDDGPVVHRKATQASLNERAGQGDTSSDVLLKLAELQSVAGFWKLDKNLADSLNLSIDRIKATIPPSWSDTVTIPIEETVWATLLVLAYLETSLAQRSDEWLLFARKAHTWLQSQATAQAGDATVANRNCEALLKAAKAVLQAK